MKTKPPVLGLLAVVAAGVAASALATSAGSPPEVGQASILTAPPESTLQEKKTEEKTSRDTEEEQKTAKITVWIMDSTGSG